MNYCNLSDVPPGETVTVATLGCDAAIRRRLTDIGLFPGARVTPVMRSPLGDPGAYRIRGAIIALRREETGKILVCRGDDCSAAN